MKRKLLTLALFLALAIGMGINNNSFAQTQNIKIAYVNLNQVLASSKTIKDAESERVKQVQDMLKWYDTASIDIQKQKTEAEKEKLIKKYESQLIQKKKNIKAAYAKKVGTVEKQLDKVISDKAKSMGYDLVIIKDTLLYKKSTLTVEGQDITSEILPLVK